MALVAIFLLAGCGTRSMSNAGYYGQNSTYRGEISEMDVVGSPDSGDVYRARRERREPRLARGAGILLIQSGALVPHASLIETLSPRYRVDTFSGIPRSSPESAMTDARLASQAPPRDAARSLRLTAAQGGYDAIVCVWGSVETERRDLGTKAVSWIPIVGWMIPDEAQEMSVRLRFAIVDVASGDWALFSPPDLSDEDKHTSFGRADAHDEQAVRLLEDAVARGTKAFLSRFGD